MPWAGNIAKTMTSNGKQFTVTRETLTAVAGISARYSNLNVSLDFVSGNIEILGKQNSLFPSGLYYYILLLTYATETVDQHQPDAGATWFVCKLLTGPYSYCNLTIHISFFRFGCWQDQVISCNFLLCGWHRVYRTVDFIHVYLSQKGGRFNREKFAKQVRKIFFYRTACHRQGNCFVINCNHGSPKLTMGIDEILMTYVRVSSGMWTPKSIVWSWK